MMISARQIEFGYRNDPVIREISFHADQHDVLTILGPNGVGKTTLLKCLNRMLIPRRGTVMISNSDARSMTYRDIARKVGYVSQRGEAARMTVYDLILLGRRPHFDWSAGRQDHELTAQVIELMELSDLALRYADELSGGELQMVQIARALVQQPEVIILDEPTNSLDIRNQHRVLSTIKNIVETHPMAAVMTGHDINLSIRYSTKFILLKGSTIFAAGDRSIITPDHMHAVYGVEMDVEEFNGVPLVIPR